MMVAATENARSESVARVVLLSNISWETYTRLVNESEGRGLRMTYDAGWLEIEMPSLKHEQIKELVGQLIVELMLYAEKNFISAGSTTWRREIEQRGAEADQCYYIAHVDQMKGVDDVDLAIHPPPDLVIEVDLSSASIEKQPIYFALGVSELWRIRGDLSVEFMVRGDRGFVASSVSTALRQADSQMLGRCLALGAAEGHATAIRAYRKMISE